MLAPTPHSQSHTAPQREQTIFHSDRFGDWIGRVYLKTAVVTHIDLINADLEREKEAAIMGKIMLSEEKYHEEFKRS